MSTVFLNGAFVSPDRAQVSCFDAGFQHGVGLFETFTAVRAGPDGLPRAVGLHEHLARLAGSARALGLTDALRVDPLGEAVRRTLVQAGTDHPGVRRFRVRLTITGGDLNLLERARSGDAPPRAHEPTLLIVAQPAAEYPNEMFERGVAVVIADFRANPLDPFAGHKTLNYWPRLRELQLAAGKRAAEALVFQVTNHLAGGCVSNAFVVKGGHLFTPIARGEETEVAGGEGTPDARLPGPPPTTKGATVPSPVLPGIVRALIMHLAAGKGLTTTRRMLTISDVLGADELFLTNSSWGVLPVVKVEREAIGDGVVGPVTKSLREAWMQSEAKPE